MRPQPTRAEADAAAWLVRLARPVVAQDDIAAFRVWREDQAHDAAFRRQQEVWRRAGRLQLDPEVRNALSETRRRRTGRSRAIRIGGLAAGAAALAAVAVFAFTSLQPDSYATSVGERSQIRLADGSSVALDADSRLTVSLARRARTVHLLRGQALFDVSHDARRPFTVLAGDLRVTALGTRFDVRRDEGREARVTLLQGRVSVQAGCGARRTDLALVPGQETSTQRPSPRPADGEEAVAWTSGRMVFREQPLAEVLAQANRYSRRRLRIESDSRLDRVRVTGVFTAGDTPAVAQALGELYDLKVDQDPDGTIVLRSS